MLANMKVFQIYYQEQQLTKLDPTFEPYDNTENPRPDLCEWYVWDKIYQQCCDAGLDYWGFVSWKFKDKTNLTGEQVYKWIDDNPGHDVYLLNPCILNEALFANSWEQGDIHHPNISTIGNTFLKKIGYPEPDVRNIILDRNKTVFSNYVVGNRKFWDKFMDFSRKLFTEAEKDAQFNDDVFGAGRSNYIPDPSLPNFTFLIERLIPTFLELESFDSIGYTYEHPSQANPKYNDFFGDIRALSDLKIAINRYESDELFNVWNYYRQKFLRENQGILGLE